MTAGRTSFAHSPVVGHPFAVCAPRHYRSAYLAAHRLARHKQSGQEHHGSLSKVYNYPGHTLLVTAAQKTSKPKEAAKTLPGKASRPADTEWRFLDVQAYKRPWQVKC